MPTKILIPAATTVEAVSYTVGRGSVPLTAIATGLGAEVITVLVSADEGLTFEAVSQDGTALEITATNNVVMIRSPGLYRFSKPSGSSIVAIAW